jgi:hypothetical protein
MSGQQHNMACSDAVSNGKPDNLIRLPIRLLGIADAHRKAALARRRTTASSITP